MKIKTTVLIPASAYLGACSEVNERNTDIISLVKIPGSLLRSRFISASLIGICTIFCSCNSAKKPDERALTELAFVKETIRSRIHDESRHLGRQLAGFARAVSGDRDFSEKLIVTADRSAPEVSEIAQQYMESMDVQLLSVVDSAGTMLSCGHFSGAIGKQDSVLNMLPDSGAIFCFDDLRGDRVFTFQSRSRFLLAETSLWVVGGHLVDENFLRSLFPAQKSRLILEQGDLRLATFPIAALSPFVNRSITVNDTVWYCDTLLLSHPPTGSAPVLYILMAK